VYLLKALRQLDQTGLLNRAKLLMGMAVLMMCAALSSFAQSDNIEMQIPMTTSITGAVRMKIPFAFTVADKTFQAGEYYVGAANEKAIAVRSVNGKQAAVALTNSVIDSRGTSLPRVVASRPSMESSAKTYRRDIRSAGVIAPVVGVARCIRGSPVGVVVVATGPAVAQPASVAERSR